MPNLFTWAALQIREKISLFSTWSVCQPHLPHLPLLLIKNPLFILILPFINNSRSILLHSVIEKQHKPMACQACECLISALPEKLKNLQEKKPFLPLYCPSSTDLQCTRSQGNIAEKIHIGAWELKLLSKWKVENESLRMWAIWDSPLEGNQVIPSSETRRDMGWREWK